MATQAAEDNPTPGDRDYRLSVFDRCSEIRQDALPPPRQPLLLDEPGGMVRCSVEDAAGRLWLGRNGGGLLRVELRAAATADVHVSPVAPTFLSAPVAPTFLSAPEPAQVTVPEPAGKPAVLAGAETSGPGQTASPPDGTNVLAGFHLTADSSDPTKLAHGIVRSLALGPAGELWVLTLPQPGTSADNREHLYRVDPESLVARRVTLRGETPPAGGDAVLQCLGVDHSGVLWLGSNAGGLRSADISARGFSLFRQRSDDVPGLDSSFVRAICRARDGLIWVGTPLGLNRMDRSQPGLVCSSTSSDGFVRLPHPNVQAICEDRHGNLWIATGGGVAVVAPTSGGVEWHRADATRPGSLSDDYVQVIHEDPEGRLWFGTLGKGVDELDPQTRRFRNHPANPDDPGGLPRGSVNALFSDRRGRLWVGTDGGLARLESAASGERPFRCLPHSAR